MPALCQNLEGKIFGRWTIISKAEKPPHLKGRKKNGFYLCRCICGTERVVNSSFLLKGRSRSCGCLNREILAEKVGSKSNSYKHGLTNTREYIAWRSMKSRCYGKNGAKYESYGGRGITVCDRWVESFENFYSDMGKKPSKRHQLDRIDNDGSYSPENCRWALPVVQANNRRSNTNITFKGKTQTVADWAREIGVGKDVLIERLVLGWSIKRALTSPVRTRDKKYSFNGESMTLDEWSHRVGIQRETLRKRLKLGWTLEKTLTTELLWSRK